MNDTTQLLTERLIALKTGEVASMMLHLGLRLGLIEAMRSGAAIRVDELADATGLHPRWVLEWLRQQTASGITEYVDEERFRLSDEMGRMLLDEGDTAFLGWMFQAPVLGAGLDRLAEAFRSGLGMTWDDHGEQGAHLVATSTCAQHRLLASEVLPRMEGVVARLRRGASAVDVGCGSGIAVLELATAFPRSTFLGIDPSPNAIAAARQKAKEAGLANAEFEVGAAEDLRAGARFHFAMVLDCIHDMTHPQEAMRSIRRALADDGVWLVKDVRCADTLRENLENPMGALLYGISIAFCMSSSMATSDGAGLGTMGLSAERARRMAEAAGFSRFRPLDYEEDPLNAFYEIRP